MQQFLFPPVKEILSKIEYEYLVIISPCEEVKQYIRECKSMVKSMIGNIGKNLSAIAHITLIHYKNPIELDELFIQAVKHVSGSLNAFSIQLKGFDYFEHGGKSNTLYVSIFNKNPIINMYQLLIKEMHFTSTGYVPHITIAKAIPREKFPEVKNHFEKIYYENEFICNKITILKKRITNAKAGWYEILFEAPLLG